MKSFFHRVSASLLNPSSNLRSASSLPFSADRFGREQPVSSPNPEGYALEAGATSISAPIRRDTSFSPAIQNVIDPVAERPALVKERRETPAKSSSETFRSTEEVKKIQPIKKLESPLVTSTVASPLPAHSNKTFTETKPVEKAGLENVTTGKVAQVPELKNSPTLPLEHSVDVVERLFTSLAPAITPRALSASSAPLALKPRPLAQASSNSSAEDRSSSTETIHIGRIEVVAAQPAPAPRPVRRSTGPKAMPLAEYLNGRKGRGA